MIDLKAVRDRLIVEDAALAPPLFLSAKDTISAGEAMESFNAIPPAAFVSTAGERAESNMLATGPRRRQRVTQTVSILFALGLERGDDERADPAEAARVFIMGRMVGWKPPGADSPFDYVSYSVVQISGGLMWGEVLVRAPWHLVSMG